ncbi:MAG TPA: dihydroneopterin aldolase [Verrucomicrobia bacterium]|nr:dihydroneopterin aldolase [Verrucomicrobiota bacterium]HOP98889.1 dihydroneopterin aldolase [Verrucomicrobiota bacterium]
MSQIRIVDLEVFYRVGVPDQERANPQRLLITIELTRDFTAAAANDDLRNTIDYFEVSQAVLRFGEGRSWKLIEKTASDLCDMILSRFGPDQVTIEIRKFVIPQAAHVSVRLTRSRPGALPRP